MIILALGLIFGIPAFLSAQTAEELDTLLETPALSCAQAAFFVLASADSGSGDEKAANAVTPEDAFNRAMENGWFHKNTAPDESVTLGKLSYLMMKAFNIKGGLLYTIFPGPRYAYRTMLSRSFIPGVADPSMKVSGERFLLILGNVLDAAEEEV